MKFDKTIFFKGFAMGTADIVPGVSGGTVALITGVYDTLIKSISSVDKEFVSLLVKFEIKSALRHINIGFLAPLLAGILVAIVSMAKILHFLLGQYSIQTWSFFFGLILASIIYLFKEIEGEKCPRDYVMIALGTLIGYSIVSLVPVSTPETLPVVFLVGSISICAMILPGISGSFILLILGKYLYITGALKNPTSDGSLEIMATFAASCVVGLLIFSRLLNFLLNNYHKAMMCVLTGFMVGSIKKVWPWKEILESKIVRGKVHVLRDMNILPTQINMELALAILAMIIGFALVFILENRSQRGISSAG